MRTPRLHTAALALGVALAMLAGRPASAQDDRGTTEVAAAPDAGAADDAGTDASPPPDDAGPQIDTSPLLDAGGGPVLAQPPTIPPAPTAPAPPEDAGEPANPSPLFTQYVEFTNANLWVLDPGQVRGEQGWTGNFGTPVTLAGNNDNHDQIFQTGVAMGVGPHVELDVYGNLDFDQAIGSRYLFSRTGFTGLAVDARVAIGRHWGDVWGNPVISAELVGRFTEPTYIDSRLLLSGVISPGLLATLNIQFARNTFHDDGVGVDYQIEGRIGIGYEVIPDILRLGIESNLGADSHNAVDDNDNTLLFPTAQLGPMLFAAEPHTHLSLVAAILFGRAYWDPPVTPQVMVSLPF